MELDTGYRGLFARFLEIEDGHATLIRAQIDALAGQGRRSHASGIGRASARRMSPTSRMDWP
jgi:hypothetical protein